MTSKQDWKKLKDGADTFVTGQQVEGTPDLSKKDPDEGELEGREDEEVVEPKKDPAQEALERRKQQAELFEKYLDDTGLSKAFQLIFAQIIAKKVPAEHVFTYSAMRLRNIGTELDTMAKRKA